MDRESTALVARGAGSVESERPKCWSRSTEHFRLTARKSDLPVSDKKVTYHARRVSQRANASPLCDRRHVMQYWLIDERGNFIRELLNLETMHRPDSGNILTCLNCGADATVK
jgi:hypothetical protein